jgi:type II secretory pathway pseudopilin PulG
MSITRRLRALCRHAAGQDGFTMVNVMLAMMILGTFSATAFALANGDIPVERADQDHKRAYEAAQAGLQWYSYELDRDSAYWTKCDSAEIAPGVPAPVNIEGASPRKWRTLPGGAKYTLEIMSKRDPSTGAVVASCSTSDAVGTALQNNTLRLRATGVANGKTRSIIATFKRRSFMDFVYFTNSEAQDPIVGGGTDAKCSAQRAGPPARTGCTEINFVGPDTVKGPLHTNDSSVLTSGGTIQFGRAGKADAFEVNGPAPGYVGSGSPVFNGPQKFFAGQMDPPPGNSSLKTLAGASWTFTGDTCLVFKDDKTVDVYQNQNWALSKQVTCNTQNGGTVTNKPLTGVGSPPNGVIYVQTSTTSVPSTCGYDQYQRYTNDKLCGDVAVQGTYASDITIGSENDIVVNGDLKQKSGADSMLGLVATGFIRVYHPITNMGTNDCGGNTLLSGFTHVQRIDAAMLSLAHSFMVDNYMCGDGEGNLTVNGAIAQYYRGVVGTGNGDTGYIKDYNYDDRLKVREPPNFLDPVKTSWRIVRSTEQKPPTTGP